MSLPIFQDPNKNMMLMQTRWATDINPVLANVLVNGQLLKNIELSTGVNVINHLLSRQMQGWMIADIDAAVTVYRSEPMNAKTLTLTSSGSATANIWVF